MGRRRYFPRPRIGVEDAAQRRLLNYDRTLRRPLLRFDKAWENGRGRRKRRAFLKRVGFAGMGEVALVRPDRQKIEQACRRPPG